MPHRLDPLSTSPTVWLLGLTPMPCGLKCMGRERSQERKESSYLIGALLLALGSVPGLSFSTSGFFAEGRPPVTEWHSKSSLPSKDSYLLQPACSGGTHCDLNPGFLCLQSNAGPLSAGQQTACALQVQGCLLTPPLYHLL